MGAVLARFSKRFRRLVVSLCKARLPLLDAGKSDRGLPEVGVLSVDLRPARPGGRPEFELMAERLGVDLGRARSCSRGVLRDAERACLYCLEVRRCRRWLAREAAGNPQLFCPNTPLFRAIATKKAGSSPEPLPAASFRSSRRDGSVSGSIPSSANSSADMFRSERPD